MASIKIQYKDKIIIKRKGTRWDLGRILLLCLVIVGLLGWTLIEDMDTQDYCWLSLCIFLVSPYLLIYIWDYFDWRQLHRVFVNDQGITIRHIITQQSMNIRFNEIVRIYLSVVNDPLSFQFTIDMENSRRKMIDVIDVYGFLLALKMADGLSLREVYGDPLGTSKLNCHKGKDLMIKYFDYLKHYSYGVRLGYIKIKFSRDSWSDSVSMGENYFLRYCVIEKLHDIEIFTQDDEYISIISILKNQIQLEKFLIDIDRFLEDDNYQMPFRPDWTIFDYLN